MQWQCAAHRLKKLLRLADTGKQYPNDRNSTRMDSDMPIPCCSVHERLFDPQHNTWINWSQDRVAVVQHLCDIRDSATIAYSDYKVIEAACDRCIEVARQILHAQLEKGDLLL